MIKEFKDFIMRGNVLDLAVAVIIGGAFGSVVSSLVNDIIMPPIGLLLGKVNFANLFADLSGQGFTSLADAQKAGAATINYGLFINTIINFLIVAFVIFMVLKAVNRAKKPAPAAAPTTKACPYCLSEVPLKATRCPHCTSEIK
jgi:large conductance mechanosensitive channel